MQKAEVKYFLEDLRSLKKLPASNRFKALEVAEYPFDRQLLTASSLYRKSRKLYLSLGGTFRPTLCSTMRALSAQDLFKDEIQYTPSFSELEWFESHFTDVSDPDAEMKSLGRFNEISLYHEQNHRILWRLLPPAPTGERDLCRYLNFAESLVVALDLALGDELGKKESLVFERMKIIYRSAGKRLPPSKSGDCYREYLLAAMLTTYLALEVVHNDDILPAVNYILPGKKTLNKLAVQRGLELSELFTRVTNPQWQQREWKSSQKKLSKMHADSESSAFYLAKDPLDFEEELAIARSVFNFFGV